MAGENMLYKGSVLKKYLIDRYAMGISDEAIKAEFLASQGEELKDEDIRAIMKDCEPEVRAREEELIRELSSSNFLISLNQVRQQLMEVRELALEKKDFKSYAQLSNSLLKSIDSLIGVSESFKLRNADSQRITTQNNYLVLTVLEKDGLISIPNREKFLKALGMTELKEDDVYERTWEKAKVRKKKEPLAEDIGIVPGEEGTEDRSRE